MKPYLLAFSLMLFFSFSLNAQATKKVNTKSKITQQRPSKKIGFELDSLPPWVKDPGKNTPQTRGVQSNISGATNNQGQIRGQRKGNIQPKPGGSGIYRDSLPWVKDPVRNTPQTRGVQSNANGSTLPFKGSDEELQSKRQRRGTDRVVDHKSDDQKIQTRGNRNINQNRGTRNVNRQKKGGGQNVVMSGGSTMIKKGGKQNRNRKQGTTKRKRKNN